MPIRRAVVYINCRNAYANSWHLATLIDIGQLQEYWLHGRPNVQMRRLKNIQPSALRPILDRYQLSLNVVPNDSDIPHSFWGAPEAGRYQSTMYAREDTPIHSLLHETAHFICMPPAQRKSESHDAGGSALIENACCFLQIALSDHIPDFSQPIHMHDMDSWGYNFRLGSTARWFYADSDDAREWLQLHSLIDETCQPTWKLRSNL